MDNGNDSVDMAVLKAQDPANHTDIKIINNDVENEYSLFPSA